MLTARFAHGRLSVILAFLPLATALLPHDASTDTALAPAEAGGSAAYVSTYRIISTHKHCEASPCGAFTEGLAFDAEGRLFESNGGYSGSSLRGLRQLDLDTGASIGLQIEPQQGQFVEGLTVLPDNRLLQLTYREGQVNEYRSAPSLALARTVSVALGDEGWGLTRSADGSVLYVTDSTDRLLHVNATTLEVVKTVHIFDPRLADGGSVSSSSSGGGGGGGSSSSSRGQGKPIWGVNELELVGDEVWGNVYPTCANGASGRRTLCGHSECVVRVDPASGRVLGWVDFTSLVEREPSAVRSDLMNSVLNGIAYHNESDRLFVTGKNWDSVYRVAIEPTSQGPEHIASVCNLAA